MIATAVKTESGERYKRRRKIQNPIVLIFIIALAAVCLTVITALVLGYRYYSTDKGYSFLGKTVNGQPVSGTVRLPDGVSAELDYVNGKMTYSDGNIYTGEIKGMYRHGKGKMVFKGTGDVYEGEFRDDCLTGYGIYTYENGDVYEGYLLDGSKEGTGKYNWASGAHYEGAFKNGLADGLGVFTWSDGDRYEGNFTRGRKNGSGKFTFAQGDYYEGEYVNDRMCGKGTYKWANGESYTGTFFADRPDTRIIKDGEYVKNGKQYAHGEKAVYTRADGKTYTGYFENGKIVVIDEAA